MADSSDLTTTAFRYMSRFRCIGPACEASCCGWWTITVDRAHYNQTKHAMRETPEERREFDAKVKRVKGPTKSDARYALMVLNNRECGFLNEERLCSLQVRYGEEVLSDTCSQYPRSLSSSGSRLELTGTTSCPEVARQLLLHADALELDEVPAAMMGRHLLRQILPDHPVDPYKRYHDELRNLVLDVLSDRRFDLGMRLSQVAYFGDRTRPFLHAGVATLDEARLSAEVERIHDPNQRTALAREFAKLNPPASLALRIAFGFVLHCSGQPRFEELRMAVLRSYHPSISASLTADSEDFERVGQAILQAYEQRKKDFHRFAPRIDQALANYAKNYWVRQWYASSHDLLTHTMTLLVLLAAIRFMVLGHPLLAETAGLRSEQQGELVDRALVEIVFRFSRTFEHGPNLLETMREDLEKKKLVTLAHAVSLARF
ncbi:MAG: flagellin lysine-N-methylase [Polyangiales bacterium]